MTNYCAYGARRRTNFKDTEIPVPDIVQIGASFLADIGLLIPGTEWLAPFLEVLIGQYITTDAFCINGPYPDPGPLSLEQFARAGSLTQLLMEYVQYFGWAYMCECNPGNSGSCEAFPYPGTPTSCTNGNIGADLVGSAGNQYDVFIYDETGLAYTYLDYAGPLLVYWNYPTSEGGGEGGTRRVCRVWSGVSGWSVPDCEFNFEELLFTADSNLGFPNIANWTVQVCPHGDDPPPVTPPDITPPDDPGVPTPITVTCATLDDVCAAIDSLRTLVRYGALGYLGTQLLPTGFITMTGDNHASVIADALTFDVGSIPAWAPSQGTDVPNYNERYGRNDIGWYAVGSQDAWYDRRYIHFQSQHSGLLPADVSRITWSIGAGVTVTATTYVRAG